MPPARAPTAGERPEKNSWSTDADRPRRGTIRPSRSPRRASPGIAPNAARSTTRSRDDGRFTACVTKTTSRRYVVARRRHGWRRTCAARKKHFVRRRTKHGERPMSGAHRCRLRGNDAPGCRKPGPGFRRDDDGIPRPRACNGDRGTSFAATAAGCLALRSRRGLGRTTRAHEQERRNRMAVIPTESGNPSCSRSGRREAAESGFPLSRE